MTTFYRFPSNMNLPAESVREGIDVSVIGDYYEPVPDPLPEPEIDENGEPIPYQPVYVGYLVNTSKPIAEWAEFEVTPTSPMRIFG